VPETLRQFSVPPRSAGFTLLEVLLAFVAFAISFAVVLQIITGSMRNTARARDYTETALIAQSIMDQVGLDIPLESGTSASGEEGEYTWQLEIHPFSGDGGNERSIELGELTGNELLEVEFIVTWGVFPRERSRRFSTVKAVMAKGPERNQ
jgi:general secretion pathway protein I